MSIMKLSGRRWNFRLAFFVLIHSLIGNVEAECTRPIIPHSNSTSTTPLLAEDTSVVVKCHSGYSNGDSQISHSDCKDGVLNPPVPLCYADCRRPVVPHSDSSSPTPMLHHGEPFNVTCNSGYSDGKSEGQRSQCENGHMNPFIRSCYANCVPRKIPHSDHSQQQPDVLSGQTTTINCWENFSMGPETTSITLTCYDGELNDETVICYEESGLSRMEIALTAIVVTLVAGIAVEFGRWIVRKKKICRSSETSATNETTHLTGNTGGGSENQTTLFLCCCSRCRDDSTGNTLPRNASPSTSSQQEMSSLESNETRLDPSSASSESDRSDPDDGAVSEEQLDRLYRVVKKEELLNAIANKYDSTEQHFGRIVGSRSKLKKVLKECLGLGEESAILRIIYTTLKDGYVTDDELNEIAKHFPASEYVDFCTKLGFMNNIPDNILASHSNNYRQALRKILGSWKDKAGGPRMELEAAIIATEAGKYAGILYVEESVNTLL